jgi:hypothetical protein
LSNVDKRLPVRAIADINQKDFDGGGYSFHNFSYFYDVFSNIYKFAGDNMMSEVN